MMWRTLGVCLCLLSLPNLAGAQPQAHMYASAQATSPAIAIEKFDSNWATASAGNYAQVKARAGLEVKLNPIWSVGLEQRLDYVLHFSEPTAQFYKKLENQGLAPGDYPLQLSVNAVMGTSFFAQYFIPLSNRGSFSIKTHVLQPNRVQDGQLTGVGHVAADGSSDYRYELDYNYDQNQQVNGNDYPVSGWGHSFDVQYKYRAGQSWSFTATWLDVLHRIYWSAINRDVGCLSRPNQADCFVTSKQKNQVQKLPVTSEVLIEKSLEAGLGLYLRASQWSRHDSLQIGAKVQGLNLGVDLLTDAIHLAYESDMVRLKLASDQLALSKSKYLQVSLDVYWPIL